MNTSFRPLCLIALVLLFVGTLEAQQTGEIRGKISEEKGEALAGVAVAARSPNLQGVRSAVSDEKGFFRLPLLPVGVYSLTFELAGFEKTTLEAQDVHLGFTAGISVVLKPAVLNQEITVTSPSPLIDATKSDTSYRLKGEELTRIPTQARSIADIVGYTPGVTGARVNTITGGAANSGFSMWQAETGLPSFRGEGDAGNNWLIDGLSTKRSKSSPTAFLPS